MIVYSASLEKFSEDVLSNSIGEIVANAFKRATGKNVAKSEYNAWEHSLQYVDRVLSDKEIPDNSNVSIEYHLPQSSKRVDFILAGKGSDDSENIILIELKQWEKAEKTDKDAIVVTRFMHGSGEVLHPSYQAWSYKRLLEDYNNTVQEDRITIYPCAYLHNYADDGVITNSFYIDHINNAPVFLKNDALKLRQYIKQYIKHGDTDQIMNRIDHGKTRPSKNLADSLRSMLEGNQEFVLIDDQKIIFETVRKAALRASPEKKKVLIVQGGPGTGKSVVAINLLVELTGRGIVAQYVTRNSAPRLVYEAKLTKSFKKSHVSNLFSSSGSFHTVPKNSFDCLIVDEAHRLSEKSGMFSHLGENQVKEIIDASKCSVFFLDEDQKVTLKDIGDKDQIVQWATMIGADVKELVLESQFRCNGSDGYLAWLDNTLQIRNTANKVLDTSEYDFKIFDDVSKLHEVITAKNIERNKARMVAGYCWKWISKKDTLLKDISIDNYKATWNLVSDGQTWIIQPDSVKEVGCIHTCQGLEVDYIGVIVGQDFVVRNGVVKTQPHERATSDKSIQGWKSLVKADKGLGLAKLDAIIKNTYRTLMTRGQKGCYVYFVDKETQQYFSERLQTYP